MACEYFIGDKKFSEQEFKDFLLKEGLDSFVEKKAIDFSKVPPKPPKPPKSEIGGEEELPKSRKMSVSKRLLEAKNIPDSFKEAIKNKGLDYKVSNQSEAAEIAKGIVNTLGVDEAIELAAREDIDPSVGSAVYAESLNKLWSEERALREKGDIKGANEVALKYAETSYDYAKKSNSKGKWNAQISYFYKTSPMGIAIKIEKERQDTFKNWLEERGEEGLKEAFDFIVESEKGQSLVSEQVESLRKEERKEARKKVEKKIDDFFDSVLLKGGGTYAVPIPPNVWNAVVNGMREGTKAGYKAADIVANAIVDISKAIGEEWDKEAFRKEYEEKLGKVIGGGAVAKTETQLLEAKIKSLEKQIKDYNDLIEKGGGRKNKTKEEKFKDDEKVAELTKERDRLRKENDKLVRAANKVAETPNEEAIKKKIEKLEEELDRVTFRKQKEKPEKGTPREKQFTDKEKELLAAIESENKKWDAEIDATRQSANDYKKLETERNRQLKRIDELNEKLDTLLGGRLPETKKIEPKQDTPEIESIKNQIKAAEKAVRENNAHQSRIEKLEEELDRLKNRKEREKQNESKREISDRESELRKEIETERLSWKIENNIDKLNEELQRVKDRKEKVVEPKQKRKLTDTEKSILEQIKEENERWRKEVEPAKKEAAEIKRKNDRIAELNRRIDEVDFSAEAYKAKKEKTELDNQLDEVKKAYDEAKKKSPEFLDKKAKKYLDRLRKRLSGLDNSQKEAIIRRSIKQIIDSGGLQYDEFKDIVSDVLGIKKLTDAEIKKLESLTEQVNAVDQLEIDYLSNPTKESRDKFVKAKEKSLEADKEIFEMTHNEADIMGTVKSVLTFNLLSGISVVKNFAQNAIYQGLVRLPISIVDNTLNYGKYYASVGFNRAFGTKIFTPNVSILDAQKGYFKEYNEGLIRGYKQMIKGVDEKDYFQSTQYDSNLNPVKSKNYLKAYFKGDLYLTKKQLIDKGIQATMGWQPYAVSRLMIYGDKPPRYAAQGAAAIQIGIKELGLKDPMKLEAFLASPEKYAYMHFREKGFDEAKSGESAKSISKRIVDAGAKATFQNENMLNDFLSKADEWARFEKDDKFLQKLTKGAVSLAKTTQLPFIKTPANIAWAYIKMANPALSITKSAYEWGVAKKALSKGNVIEYREYANKAQESFAMAAVGASFSLAAMALFDKGLIRVKKDDEDKLRETEGERFFGKDNEIDLGTLLGGDEFWVDLTWFSAVGTIINTKARIMQKKKEKGESTEEDILGDILPTLQYSAIESMNSLVFDNGAKIIDAFKKGGNKLDNFTVSLFNTFSNGLTGATLPAISKAMLPEKANLKADNVLDQIINNQKERNIFVRWAAGNPPTKISMWGERTKNDGSISGVMGNMFGFQKGTGDKFGAILYKDEQRSGKSGFFPPVEDYNITVNGKNVKITTKEKEDLDTFIGQARKSLVSAFVYEMSSPVAFGGKKYSQIENDDEKILALKSIYENAQKAGMAKFKDKYIQYKEAELTRQQEREKDKEQVKKERFNTQIEKVIKNR